jgi:hypothetical protein
MRYVLNIYAVIRNTGNIINLVCRHILERNWNRRRVQVIEEPFWDRLLIHQDTIAQ